MVSVKAYIDDDLLIQKLINKCYSEEGLQNLIDVIEEMNKCGDSIFIESDLYIRLCEHLNTGTELFLEMLSLSEITDQIDLEIVKKSIENNKYSDKAIMVLDVDNCLYYQIQNFETLRIFLRKLILAEKQGVIIQSLGRCFNNCVFSDGVGQSIKRIKNKTFKNNIDTYIKHLSDLNDKAIDIWKRDDCINNDLFCKIFQSVTGIDVSTENDRKTANNRYFNFSLCPHKIKCEKHTKVERYGKNAQRIYFEIKEIGKEEKEKEYKVLIGYIGNHL